MQSDLSPNAIDQEPFLSESLEIHLQAIRMKHSEESKIIRQELEELNEMVKNQRLLITTLVNRLNDQTNRELNRLHRKIVQAQAG